MNGHARRAGFVQGEQKRSSAAAVVALLTTLALCGLRLQFA
jgi:hypothetical protein